MAAQVPIDRVREAFHAMEDAVKADDWSNPGLDQRIQNAYNGVFKDLTPDERSQLHGMIQERRGIQPIRFEEAPLPHQVREVSHLAPPSETAEVRLPDNTNKIHGALFTLHRQIERQYKDLPWPAQMQKIVVFTDVQGGRGDIVAAAKAIAILQRMCPTLTFDWVLKGAQYDQYDPISFLHCDDPSKVSIRDWQSQPPEEAAGDLLLYGPAKCTFGTDYIESRINRKINGSVFGFLENAQKDNTAHLMSDMLQEEVEKANPQASNDQIYQTLHPTLFFDHSDNSFGQLPMGLQLGSGVFLDRSRLDAPLSRGYCDPSYLRQIQDASLRGDILEAMNVFDDESLPDYDQFSFNSGYAHRPASWGKFIDCVAMHEKNKHAVIVLNQRGESANLSTKQFQEQIFTPERLAFLKDKGYGTVAFKGAGEDASLLQKGDNPQSDRRLTVIVRRSFAPDDMKCMQLASERLLATGDNSAVESWCARCKLYLYEDVSNMGSCKWRFLQQQVDLAQDISPNLGKLLALFGGDKRLEDRCLNQPLTAKKMAELEELLNDPDLGDATLQLCDRITANYSFEAVLEAALKRTAWHHSIPELAQIEAEAIDEDFRTGLVTYLKNPEAATKDFQIKNLPELGRRVQDTVLKQQPA